MLVFTRYITKIYYYKDAVGYKSFCASSSNRKVLFIIYNFLFSYLIYILDGQYCLFPFSAVKWLLIPHFEQSIMLMFEWKATYMGNKYIGFFIACCIW
jgi:hypothetical protein